MVEFGVFFDEKNLLDEIFGGVGVSWLVSGGVGLSGVDLGLVFFMGFGNIVFEGREEGNGVEFIWLLSNNVVVVVVV